MDRLPKHEWYPTKAVKMGTRWLSNRKSPISSRRTADLQIAAYQGVLTEHARGRLLDLGCGNAPYAGIYASLVSDYEWADWPGSPHQVFELDYSIDLNNTPLPFSSNSYDTILLTDVLEHIAEPNELMQEVRRVLAPHGKVIIGVPFLYPIHEHPHDHFRYTRYQLQYIAEKHALEIISLDEIGGVLDVIFDLLAKATGSLHGILAYIPYHFWRVIATIGFVARANRESSLSAPLAYVMVLQKPR